MFQKKNATIGSIIEDWFSRIRSIGIKTPFRSREISTLFRESVNKLVLFDQNVFFRGGFPKLYPARPDTWRTALKARLRIVTYEALF